MPTVDEFLAQQNPDAQPQATPAQPTVSSDTGDEYTFEHAKKDLPLLQAIKRYALSSDNKVFANDDQALEWWKSDRRWKDANTYSILNELNTVNKGLGKSGWGDTSVSKQDLEDLSVIRDRWEKIPGVFSPSRGTGLGERVGALAEDLAKGVADPAILAGGIGGKAVGAAADVGLKALGKEALTQGTKQAIRIGGGIAADAVTAGYATEKAQEADIGLGRQDDLEWNTIIAGGALGGALSIPGHVAAGKQAVPKKLDIKGAKEQALSGAADAQASGTDTLFTPKEREKFLPKDEETKIKASDLGLTETPPTQPSSTLDTTLSSDWKLPAPKLQPAKRRVLDVISGNLVDINNPDNIPKLINSVKQVGDEFGVSEPGVGKTTIAEIDKGNKAALDKQSLLGAAADVQSLPQGYAPNSAEVRAIRTVKGGLSELVMDESKTPLERLAAFRASIALSGKDEALASESGRALAMYRYSNLSNLTPSGFLGKTIKTIKKVTGQESDLLSTEAGQKELLNDVTAVYKDLMTPGPDGKVNPLAIDLFHVNIEKQGLTGKDALYEAWYNSLLSGPQTQIVNFTGNVASALMQVAEDSAGMAAVGVNPAKMIVASYRKSIPEMWNVFKRTFSTEIPNDPMTRMELKQSQAVPSWKITFGGSDDDALVRWRRAGVGETGNLFTLDENGARSLVLGGRQLRLPGRFLMSMDDAFKTLHQNNALNAAAIMEIQKEAPQGIRGMSTDEFQQALKDKVANPTQQMVDYSKDISRVLTYTRPLGKFGQGIQQIVDAFPGGRLVVPFVRTPGDLIKYSADMLSVPGIAATKRTSEDFAAGGFRRAQATARIFTGYTIMTMGAVLAENGLVSGGGPSDPAEKATWLTNNLPWSIRVGNQWVQWSRLDPVAIPFAIGASYKDLSDEWKDPTREGEFLSTVTKLFADAVLDKSWFQGVQNAMNAVTNPDRTANNFAQGIVRSFVPSVVASTGRAYDPRVLAPQTFMEVIQDRLAFDARSKQVAPLDAYGREIPNYTLNPKQDALGRDIPIGVLGAPEGSSGIGAGIARMVSPFKTKEIDADPVAKEVDNLRIKIAPVSDNWNGIKLTSEQKYVLSKSKGQYIYNGIAHAMQSSNWDKLSPGVKRIVIDSITKEAGSVGDVMLQGVYPDLIKIRNRPENNSTLKKFIQPTREQLADPDYKASDYNILGKKK